MKGIARSYQIRSQLTCNADKFLGLHSDDLLLEQACTSALDAVQFLVHLVRAVEGHIEDGAWGKSVEFDSSESRIDNHLLGLVTGWDVLRDGGVHAKGLDRLDDIDDGCATANSDPASILGVVRLDGYLCGSALGFFNGGHGGHGGLESEIGAKKCGEGESPAEKKRGDQAGWLDHEFP